MATPLINPTFASAVKSGAKKVGSALGYTAGKLIDANLPGFRLAQQMNASMGKPEQLPPAKQVDTQSKQFVQATTSPTPLGVRSSDPNANVATTPTTLAPKDQAQRQPSGNLTQQQLGSSAVATKGLENMQGGTPTTQPQQVQPQQVQAQQSPYGGQGGLYGSLIAALAGRGVQESPEVRQAREALKQSQLNQAQSMADIANTPIPLEFQQGRAQVLQSQYGQQQAALSNALQSALTSQGQQIGAIQGAAGLAQPVSQFGMLTNPITGTPLNTQVFQGAIQQAQQLVNQDVPVNDASVQSLLSPFGFVGPMAFNNAMMAQSGGSWNPAAQSVAAMQNLQYGTDVQAQAQKLSQGLQTLDAMQPKILGFMNSAGINPTDIPAMNAKIGDYLAQFGSPDARAQWQAIRNEISIAASNILGSRSLGTPTSNDEQIAAQDPSLLSMNQLNTVLNTWSNLGNTALGVLQQNASMSRGGYAGYAGVPAQSSPYLPTPSQSSLTPGQQAAAGLGIGAVNYGLDFAKIIPALSNFLFK